MSAILTRAVVLAAAIVLVTLALLGAVHVIGWALDALDTL